MPHNTLSGCTGKLPCWAEWLPCFCVVRGQCIMWVFYSTTGLHHLRLSRYSSRCLICESCIYRLVLLWHALKLFQFFRHEICGVYSFYYRATLASRKLSIIVKWWLLDFRIWSIWMIGQFLMTKDWEQKYGIVYTNQVCSFHVLRALEVTLICVLFGCGYRRTSSSGKSWAGRGGTTKAGAARTRWT